MVVYCFSVSKVFLEVNCVVLNFDGESELETVRGRGIVVRRFKEGVCIS